MAQVADELVMESLRQSMGQNPGPKVPAKFSMEATPDFEATEKAGIQKFKEEEFITKWIPGDKDNVIFRPVRAIDKIEYPTEYAAFKANQEQPQNGTPLSIIPWMSKAQVAELNAFGVRTAEEFVNVSDTNGQRFIGFHQLKTRVKTYLDAAAGAAPALKLQSELEKRDQEITLLKQLMEEQGKKMDELMISKRKPA